MKSEAVRTGLFLLAAVILAVTAAWVEPEARRADIFNDQGEQFFPALRDITAVKAIEVVDYDEAEAVARPLKVELRKGRWMLTSHHDYPAEAQDRMAKTAAALVDLSRELVISDRWEDQGNYGIIDPLDTRNPSLTGRGKRVTLRDAQGGMLADLVLGYAVKERAGYRYVRLPGQKRTYAVKTDADPSTKFEDWVEADLLKIAAGDVRRITVNSYSIDETMGRLTNLKRTVFTRDGGNWTVEPAGTATPADAQRIAATLGSLRVVGARPKPLPLAQQLREKKLQMTLETVMSLRQRGFFLTPLGQLLSNEGEMVVETARGLVYGLRFGEVVTGATEMPAPPRTSPPAAGSPAPTAPKAPPKAGENRYLFVTVSFDAARAAKYGSADGNSQALAGRLDTRFADWYYVISGADFEKLRARR